MDAIMVTKKQALFPFRLIIYHHCATNFKFRHMASFIELLSLLRTHVYSKKKKRRGGQKKLNKKVAPNKQIQFILLFILSVR